LPQISAAKASAVARCAWFARHALVTAQNGIWGGTNIEERFPVRRGLL
jgi:hypothetical protein